MDAIRIRGSRKLPGRIQVSGAKKAALPSSCATWLGNGDSLLRNVPGVRDIETSATRLRFLRREAPLITARVAERETLVRRVYHFDRGYPGIEKKLARVGADIERINIADEDR